MTGCQYLIAVLGGELTGAPEAQVAGAPLEVAALQRALEQDLVQGDGTTMAGTGDDAAVAGGVAPA